MPDIAALVQDHGYWILGLIVLLENAGIPVPGETALLAAGYLSSSDGGSHLYFGTVVIVAFFAAVLGDNVGFLLGHYVARRRLAAGRRFLFLTPERMVIAERYFHKYGVFTVFIARFVTILRVIAGPAAGASGMKWGRFFAANAAGALCWSLAIAAIGHFAGHAFEAMKQRVGNVAWYILGAVLAAFIVWRVTVYIRRSHIRPETPPEKTEADVTSPASGLPHSP